MQKVYDGTPEALNTQEDVDGLLASRDYIQSLIQHEIDHGILPEKIVVGGFSQGGVISILAGLTFLHKLGGIVLLSSWLPLVETFMDLVPDENLNRDTPIFIGHGIDDRMVPLAVGKKSFDALSSMGFNVSWEVYP